ncbi:MAG: hypothetical protein JNM93_01665, partial [Bacteriovoracaceae bacterium]|nr:hypothetical protein [Bacteriovoracaceae bacterium]
KLAHILDLHQTYLEEYESLKKNNLLPAGFSSNDEKEFKQLIEYIFLSDAEKKINLYPASEIYQAAENKNIQLVLKNIKSDLNENRSLFNFVEGSIDALYKSNTEFTPNVRDFFILNRENYVDLKTRRGYADITTVSPAKQTPKIEPKIKTPSFFTRCLLKTRNVLKN